tara:strand:- start:244 stop:372 length:129 start_codon:yes stop_codon:yes gene_type:complete
MVLDEFINISDKAAESISKFKFEINEQNPKEWIESLQRNDEI